MSRTIPGFLHRVIVRTASVAAGDHERARDHLTRALARYAELGAPEPDEIRKQLSAGL
jgi:hypothetical protein